MGEKTVKYPCPTCGFEVFEEPLGSYDICPVCGWEDDDVQARFPLLKGGANRECLFERQQRLLQRLPFGVNKHSGYPRCCDWRPLTLAECNSNAERMPTTGVTYFDAAAEEPMDYYWRKNRTEESDRAAGQSPASDCP